MAERTLDLALGSIEWSEPSVSLRELAGKHPVPNVVKVTKGQYRNIGVAKSTNNELYLHSIRNSKKVFAESVKLKEHKKAVISDQKYSLPITYQGWFEVLSEDGKAVKGIQNIQDLLKVFPQTCLVRENIKAYVPRENGDLTLDRVRTVHTGEMLALAGELAVNIPNSKSGAKRRMLKCLDSKGDAVYFGCDQKGLFSPIAGHTNISGVHNIKGLLDKFRLPIMVRLVHGIIPTKLEKGFTAVFRLLNTYTDETAFVCPWKKDAKLVPVSTREPLRVVVAEEFDKIRDSEECVHFQGKCSKMLASYLNSIHVLYSLPDPIALVKNKDVIKPSESGLVSTPVAGAASSQAGPENNKVVAPVPGVQKQEEDILFMEVEDIYQYVRDGGQPPAPRARLPSDPTNSNSKSSNNSNFQRISRSSGKKISANKFILDDKDGSAVVTDNTKSTGVQSPDSTPTSPVAMADPTLPSPLKDAVDDSYWVEPIYEPLDKIRNKKKRDSAGLEPQLQSRIATMVQEQPVENLRQLYKQQSQSQDRHSPTDKYTKSPIEVKTYKDIMKDFSHAHVEDTGADAEMPPPIPPKHYNDVATVMDDNSAFATESQTMDLEEESRLSELTRLNADRGNSMHMNGVGHYGTSAVVTTASALYPTRQHSLTDNRLNHVGNSHHISQPNAHPHHSAIARAQSRPQHLSTNNGTHLVYTRSMPDQNGASRISVMSPNPVIQPTSPLSHPPYVAVARVGDLPPNAATQYNNGLSGSPTDRYGDKQLPKTDNNRKKLHNLFL